MSIHAPLINAVSAAAPRGSARAATHAPGRVGNWPDPMRQLCGVGNWPDPMRQLCSVGNWPDPMRPAAGS